MARKKKFVFNRVLKVADYKMLDVHVRKMWEIRMALKTLRELGATSSDAIILGAGAARERTIFELANVDDARLVIPTDLYADMGVWAGWAGVDFLKSPSQHAPNDVGFDAGRILPRHADMCHLPFEDNMFDGVFSSGSIEHVGKQGIADYDAISKAAAELGRVTKPGGIISLSTEWKLSGDGWGWGHVRLFDADTIMRVIVEASGCELVDKPDWSFDGDLDDALPLVQAIREPSSQVDAAALSEHGFVFTSVHLALRKPA